MEPVAVWSGITCPAGMPHTPPYTPLEKRPLRRDASPASSVHPFETTSPSHRGHKRSNTVDTIKVEELKEGDAGYVTDLDVVYPEDLEEAETASENAMSSSSDAEDLSNMEITRRLSLLRCGDDSEVRFERERQMLRKQRRLAKGNVKRAHSEIILSADETSDPEVQPDHDLLSSQRRMRRRTKGPASLKGPSPPPSPLTTRTEHLWSRHGNNLTPTCVTEDENDNDEQKLDDDLLDDSSDDDMTRTVLDLGRQQQKAATRSDTMEIDAR